MTNWFPTLGYDVGCSAVRSRGDRAVRRILLPERMAADRGAVHAQASGNFPLCDSFLVQVLYLLIAVEPSLPPILLSLRIARPRRPEKWQRRVLRGRLDHLCGRRSTRRRSASGRFRNRCQRSGVLGHASNASVAVAMDARRLARAAHRALVQYDALVQY
jgi:hypothetical protein